MYCLINVILLRIEMPLMEKRCGYCKKSVDGKGAIMFGNKDGPLANYCKKENWVSPTENVKKMHVLKKNQENIVKANKIVSLMDK